MSRGKLFNTRNFLGSNLRRNGGFTLLEVLIAIVITSLIGLGSWQLMNSAIRSSNQTQVRLDELAVLQKAMFHFSRDMQQVIARAIRNDFGDYEGAVTTKTDFYKLEFTRTGWRNPLNDQRSELQRVAYELDADNQLIRHYWLVLDRVQDSQPRSRTLLKDVENIEFSFLSNAGKWATEWPPELQDDGEEGKDPLAEFNQMPKAIRVVLEHSQFGEIARVFETTAYINHTDVPAVSNGGDGGDEGGGNGNDDNNGGGGNGGNGGGVVSGDGAEESR